MSTEEAHTIELRNARIAYLEQCITGLLRVVGDREFRTPTEQMVIADARFAVEGSGR